MRRHSLICKFGAQDTTPVSVVQQDSIQTIVQMVQAKRRFDFGIGDALEHLQRRGVYPSEMAHDLLVIAASVYCADTRLNRQSEAQDNWTREIDIYAPVSSTQLWNDSASLLSSMLEFLSGDKWRFFFRERPTGFEEIIRSGRLNLRDNSTCACLFSGGLDSFIGAIDLLERGEKPILVSHSWVPIVSNHQDLCARALMKQYGAPQIRRLESRVGFPKSFVRESEAEDTERSRSFLFFSLGAFAASGLQANDPVIYVPENGLISLNVPLDPLRLGSLSTRTTHPHFMDLFNKLLARLEIRGRVLNPYVAKTKGEMVKECANQQFLADQVAKTMSCSSPTKGRWQGLAPGHCGYCLPCLIRRASMVRWDFPDSTKYHVDLERTVFDSLKAEGDAIRSFQLASERLRGDIRRARVLIHKSGPLPGSPEEIEALAGVYARGMAEVQDLLKTVETRPNASAAC
jgi:7-cyano-7-deazaguanine synthase in queuosine biosynthesis